MSSCAARSQIRDWTLGLLSKILLTITIDEKPIVVVIAGKFYVFPQAC